MRHRVHAGEGANWGEGSGPTHLGRGAVLGGGGSRTKAPKAGAPRTQ